MKRVRKCRNRCADSVRFPTYEVVRDHDADLGKLLGVTVPRFPESAAELCADQCRWCGGGTSCDRPGRDRGPYFVRFRCCVSSACPGSKVEFLTWEVYDGQTVELRPFHPTDFSGGLEVLVESGPLDDDLDGHLWRQGRPEPEPPNRRPREVTPDNAESGSRGASNRSQAASLVTHADSSQEVDE